MINTNHPDYPKYIAEREQALAEYKEKRTAIEAKMKAENFSGKDGPSVKIDKEFGHKLKELQRKYYYLFY